MVEQEKTQSDVRIIVETAAKTVYALVIVAALAFTLFYLLFPFSAYRLYSDFGDDYRAYDCAARAARTSDGEERVNATVAMVNCAVKVYNSDASFASEVELSTQSFLLDENCLTRAPLIDEYNLSRSAKSLHANLYSYTDYLHSLNAKARASQGKTELLHNGEYKTADELVGELTDLNELAVLYSQIAAVIEKTGICPASLTALADSAEAYISSALTEQNQLRRLYLVKAYEKLYVRLAASSADEATTQRLKNVSYDGRNYEITDLYYNKLLKDYCK